MMTRKDYVAVSKILSNYQEVMEKDDYFEMVIDFGKMMRADNERFDLSRFLEACNIDIRGMAIRAMDSVAPPKPASAHVAVQGVAFSADGIEAY